MLQDKVKALIINFLPEVDLIKLFDKKFTYSLGKLDLFIAMQQNLLPLK
jgi:hypothetical protein